MTLLLGSDDLEQYLHEFIRPIVRHHVRRLDLTITPCGVGTRVLRVAPQRGQRLAHRGRIRGRLDVRSREGVLLEGLRETHRLDPCTERLVGPARAGPLSLGRIVVYARW